MFALRVFRAFPWLSRLLDWQQTKSSLAPSYVFVFLKVAVLSGSHIYDLTRWTVGRDFITAQRKHFIMFALRAFHEFPWLSHLLDWQLTKCSLAPSYVHVFVLKGAVLSQSPLVVIKRASHLCDPGSILASGRMWAEFQSISTWLRGFFSGYSGFPPSEKSTPGQLHPAGFAVLRDHTWIVWRQPWAPSHAFGPIPLSRLTVKSPCRERSTKRTFTFTFTYDLTWYTDGRDFIKAQRKHFIMFALRAFHEFPWLSHLLDWQLTKSSLAPSYVHVFVLKGAVLSQSPLYDLTWYTDGRDFIKAQRKHFIMFALRAFREFQSISHLPDWQPNVP